MIKNFLKEPLVHFLLIGVALFFLYSITNTEENEMGKIVVDDNDLNRLMDSWKKQWNRDPTEGEVKDLIDQYIHDEIYYKEALKMGLDHNDEIIKRRLSQKMQFLAKDLISNDNPSEDTLRMFYKKNSEDYMKPYKVSFYQIYFSPDSGKNISNRIEGFLNKYKNLSIKDADIYKSEGDPSSIPFHFFNSDAFEVALRLGSKFKDVLPILEKNKWIGPVKSGYGDHILYIKFK